MTDLQAGTIDIETVGDHFKEVGYLQLPGKADIPQFYLALKIMMKVIKPSVHFVYAYPESVIERTTSSSDQRTPVFKPTITFKVFRREPASINEGSKPFSGQNMWKPRLRDRKASERDEDKIVDIYEYGLDNMVQFDIFAETNKECDEIADWFEGAMIMHAPYFQTIGIPRVFFFRRFRDEHVEGMGTGLNTRSLHYYVETKRYFEVDHYKIQQINTKLKAIVDTYAESVDFYSGTLQDELFTE